MRKIAVVVLLVFLAACGVPPPQVDEGVPAERAPVESSQVQETAPSPEPQPAPETGRTPPQRALPSEREDASVSTVTPVPKPEMSPQLRDLLKRADEKLQSFQYLYGGTVTRNLFLDTYFVKGDKMKIKKYEENYYVRDGYYDTIYVSLGVGCCEELARCKSHNVDNSVKRFDVDTSSLSVPKTPLEWVREVPASAKIIGPQTFNQRSVTQIKFARDDSEVLMWVDDTYGLPHKVVITDRSGNEVKHQFNDLKFNQLKDANFDPPCA